MRGGMDFPTILQFVFGCCFLLLTDKKYYCRLQQSTDEVVQIPNDSGRYQQDCLGWKFRYRNFIAFIQEITLERFIENDSDWNYVFMLKIFYWHLTFVGKNNDEIK